MSVIQGMLTSLGAVAVSDPPTFVSQGAMSSRDTTPGSVSPTIPAHQANDILIVSAITFDPTAGATCAGWNAIGSTASTYGGCSYYWFWLRASSGATANPTISDATAQYLRASVSVFRGCVASGTPYEDATLLDNESAINPLSSAIDTLGSNRLAVTLASIYSNGAFASYPPATWTDNSNLVYGGVPAQRMVIMSKTVAAAGNVPQVTVGAITGAKIWGTLTLGLIPA